MADPCDVCGGDAKSYGPRGRRCLACLACLAADDPALRSDVPVKCAEETCEQNEGYGCQGHTAPETCETCEELATMLRETNGHLAAAEAAADAAHAALDATTERLVAAADILRRYGDIGAQAALRALEGETT